MRDPMITTLSRLDKHRSAQWGHCQPRNTDTQRRHKSKKSEILGRCGKQNMLRRYLKIWDWDLIFSRAVKPISSLGVPSPCCQPMQNFHNQPFPTCQHALSNIYSMNWITLLPQKQLVLVWPYTPPHTARLRICTTLSWPRYSSFRNQVHT